MNCRERIVEPVPFPPLYKTIFSSADKKLHKRSIKTRVKAFFPIVRWLPEYPRNFFVLLAALIFLVKLEGRCITIAIIAIPQTISYSALASVPPIYGLYSSVVPPFIYLIFGTSRVLSVGLVAINAIIITSTISPIADPDLETERYIGLALSATCFAGFLSLLLGLLRQGQLVTFVSPQVLAGFVSSSALVIIIHTFTELGDLLPVVGYIPPGPPSFIVPSFETSDIPSLIAPTIIIMMVGYLQSYALGRKFAENASYKIDADQELVALGLSKIVGSFFQAIDTPGSFSRTAINFEAGAVSQISHVFTALIILICLYFATSLLYFLPFSTLAAIVVVAVMQLLVCVGLTIQEPLAYVKMWKISRLDTSIAILTGIATFCLSAQLGIVIGIGLSFIVCLYRLSRPHWAILGEVVQESEPEDLKTLAAEESHSAAPGNSGIRRRISSPSMNRASGSPTRSLEENGGFNPQEETDVVGSLPVRVYRDLERYSDATEHRSILIFRFDGSIYFLNEEFWRKTIMDIVSPRTFFRQGFVDTSVNSLANQQRVDLEASNPQLFVKFLVLDFSAVNDVDVSGGVTIVKTIEHLEKKFRLRVLLAGVKGPVRDLLWRSAGGIDQSSDFEVSPGTEDTEENDQHLKIEDPAPAPVAISSRFFLGVPYAVDYAKNKLGRMNN